MINFLKEEKLFFFLILFFFLFSFFKINSDISKYDKYFTYEDGTNYHAIVRSPPEMRLWKTAAIIKKELERGNIAVLFQPYEFSHHFLPEKTLGVFGKIFDIKFYNDENNSIFSSGSKRSFFIFQTLIYFLSVIFFYLQLRKVKIEKHVCLICTSFLLLEPTINQFNTTIFGETIFFSLMILIFSFLIDLPRKNSFYLFYGILIGICYLQRSVAMFLIIVPLFYIFFKFKKKSLFKIFNLIIGFLLVILILGTLNYNRTKIFYVLPTITLHNLSTYLSPKILMKKGFSRDQSINKILDEKNKIVKDKNLNLENEIDRIELAKTQKEFAVKLILDNKVLTFIEIVKSTAHSMLLNPIEVKNVRIKGKNYYKSELHQSWIKYRIAYSLVMYLIIILGIYYTIRKKIILPSIFCLVGLSIFSVSSWVGYTRYFVPLYLCLSLYFSYGLYFLLSHVTKARLLK